MSTGYMTQCDKKTSTSLAVVIVPVQPLISKSNVCYIYGHRGSVYDIAKARLNR